MVKIIIIINYRTWTLWSFQNEGSSRNSKLLAHDDDEVVFRSSSSKSRRPLLKVRVTIALVSFTADLNCRSGVLFTEGIIDDISDDDKETALRSWNPNLLLIALAVSENNGILGRRESYGFEVCVGINAED